MSYSNISIMNINWKDRVVIKHRIILNDDFWINSNQQNNYTVFHNYHTQTGVVIMISIDKVISYNAK